MVTDFNEEQQQAIAGKTDILELVAKRFLPFWPLFLLLTAGSIVLAYFKLRYTIPVYQVNAKLLLKDSKKGVDDSKIMDALNLGDEKKIIENETVVLRSWPLMKAVVSQQNLYTSQFHIGKFRNDELYGDAAPLRIIAVNKDSVRGIIKPVNVIIEWQKGMFTLAGISHRFGDTVTISGTRFVIDANQANLTDSGNKKPDSHILLQVTDVNGLANQLLNALTLEPSSKQSTVIGVALLTTIPAKGIDIINNLFRVYNEAGVTDKNLFSQRTLNFVDERLALVTKELETVENNIKDFKTREGVVDIGSQGTMYLDNVKENDEQVSKLNIQLSVLDDIERYVAGKGTRQGTVPSLIGIDDPTLPLLLNKLYDLETQLSGLSKVTGLQNDQQGQIYDQIARLKPNILENIRNIRGNFTITKNKLLGIIAQSNGLLYKLPDKEKALIAISRQQEIKNTIYSFLLQKREETALSAAAAVADSRVVEPASLGGQVSPKPNLIYLIAFASGIGVAFLVILLLESFNNKVLFRSDIEERVNAPIIGELMYDKNKVALVLKEGNRSPLAEQFRMLRTNLSFLGVDGQNKVILVSSSISGEGKSYVTSNLAIALSLTSKTVILMELDLRKPRISGVFGLSKELGVTDYLVGLNTLEQIIKSVPGVDGLSLISSGAIPPNPSELLGSDKFKELIDILRVRFDYVLFDTPPVSMVSDTMLLAPFADSTLYVMRHNYTPKSFIPFVQQLNAGKKFKNFSIVFNGIKPRGINLYGYGYGQGYGYGYGYGAGYYAADETVKGKKRFFRRLKRFFRIKK